MVNIDWHPRYVNLFLWNNYYKLTFYDEKIMDENDVMISKEYQKVDIEGLKNRRKKIDLTK